MGLEEFSSKISCFWAAVVANRVTTTFGFCRLGFHTTRLLLKKFKSFHSCE
jgi:hypothetical protein